MRAFRAETLVLIAFSGALAAAAFAVDVPAAAADGAAGSRAIGGNAAFRLAQTDSAAPVRLVPPGAAGQAPEESVRPAEAPDAEAPESSPESPNRGPSDSDGVTASTLSAPDAASVGLIDTAEGGFDISLWQGSKRALIEKLLARLPARIRSTAARALAVRLLSTRARAPQGDSGGPDLLGSRISRLVELGELDAAGRLANQIPVEQAGGAPSRSAVEALFLRNDNAGACQRVQGFVRRSLDAYWQRASAFCLLLSGEEAQANMIADILAERDDDSAPLFSMLIETLNGGEAAVVESLPHPAGLDLAMMRAANIRLPADVLSSDRPAVLRSVVASPNADLDLRLEAAERALLYGAIDAGTLLELYAAAPWEDADLADAATVAESHWGPRGRALLLRAAAAAETPPAKAAILARAFGLAREKGGYDVVAGASMPVLASIPQEPAVGWFAYDAVSALLAAGRAETAQGWLGLVDGNNETTPEARETAARLWAVARLAAPEIDAAPVEEAALTAWRRAAYGDDTAAGREATVLALSLLEALGVEAAPGRWAGLLAEGQPPQAAAPDIAWARALEEAAAGERLGETVLIALLGLDGAAAGPPDAATVTVVVRSLRRVGLEAEARALALETAVAHRL